MYACGFRIYFTPLPGFFSPFPHGTGSLSVDHEYLALEDGPPIFRQDFTCPALLVSRLVPHRCRRIRGCHPLRPAFPDRSPDTNAKSRRLLPFRSPLLWESRLLSVPPGTEMFQFPGFASPKLCIHLGDTLSTSLRLPKGKRREMVKVGFPIRKSSDQSLLTTPRRLSQRATSFFACTCQGIHQMLLPHA